MRKPVYAICEQQKRRPACVSAQSDQRLCCCIISLVSIIIIITFFKMITCLARMPVYHMVLRYKDIHAFDNY